LRRLKAAISDNTRFRLLAWPEPEYYQNQQRSSLFLQVSGTLIALLLTVGAMFAAANTMFAAVSSRTREIGTLRALGFSRLDILLSFLAESLILCALGGTLGLAVAMPLSSLTFGTSDFNTFSERIVHFRLGPMVAGTAVGLSIAMGIFGGLFPALRASKLEVIAALREI
jgi:putative ABC transport system permease protein